MLKRKISKAVQGVYLPVYAKALLANIAKEKGVSPSALAGDIIERAIKRMTKKEHSNDNPS